MPATTDHLCNFSVPMEGNRHARRCQDCGEPQVYRAPVGQPRQFPDVLVDKEDLRSLIDSYRGQAAMTSAPTDALCDRLELLLD